MKTIDIVVPCYNEEDCIQLLYAEIEKVFLTVGGGIFIPSYLLTTGAGITHYASLRS